MKRATGRSLFRVLAVLAALAGPAAAVAQDLQPIVLPKPQKTGGMPLLDALNARRTTREFAPDKLSPQVLSDLLWAAFGVNREEMPGRTPKPGRTAPSAMNLQDIDIYVALPEGVYLYEAVPHRLVPVVGKDIRAAANRNPAAGTAPVGLIYVEDLDKRPAPPPVQPRPAGAPPGKPDAAAPPRSTSGEVDTGFIGQNVYLFCASAGLNAWFYGANREELAKLLNLRPGQKVLYGQSVGYPKRK